MEFAANYTDLNELTLPYHEMSFIVYYSLDVILVSLAVLAALLWGIGMVVRILLRCCFVGMAGGRRVPKAKGD